jgi:hypothetical protein
MHRRVVVLVGRGVLRDCEDVVEVLCVALQTLPGT